MTNYKNISDYIQQQRKKADLTQEQLCQVLTAFSPEFGDLDPLAVSRWERGKVEPSLNRQLEIIRYFGDEPYQIITAAEFHSKNLPSIDAMNKLLVARAKFKHYLGAHPYLPQQDLRYQQVCPPDELADRSCQHLSHYIANLSFGCEQWDPQYLQQLQNTESSLVSYYFYFGQLAGHSYALRVKPKYFEQLLHCEIDETDVKPEMLALPSEPAGLYIYSVYAGRIQAINQIYQHLFKAIANDPSLAQFGMRVRRDIAHVMLESIPHTLEALGPPSDNIELGIKHQGKRYQFISCRIERLALLNSPVLLNILRDD
ncbi:helix-turn-helix transcriptional regulator [Agarivorans sp. MS3-6]|uniref:helix-turn-helix transcriptional regulator n=1 Tax=Agarivorans sp. TSD2052 TaxID=2937286 RepID=UPI00200CB9A6|nr:helix-turn-helix transcriptional regulator [Agarivorans sp. TSD2052]UPW17848.1 helix-turn-helix domain-containing protein [Agarivorans sp. TSD2052]